MTTATRFLALTLLAFIMAALHPDLHAQPGTRSVVQTFTFDSPSSGAFVFPGKDKRYEKITMRYKLRCPFNGPCGEWDYLMYIHLLDHTGIIDSTRDTAVSYRIDGASPDSVRYMLTPSWRYLPSHTRRIIYADTTSLATAIIGAGARTTDMPFQRPLITGRGQYLWRSEELTAAGVKAGEITGIRLNVETPGSTLKNLMIRLKGTKLDSLSQYVPQEDQFTTAYAHDTKFKSTGWNPLSFTTPYVWDGISNIVIDISYDDTEDFGNGTVLRGDSTTYLSSVFAQDSNRVMNFQGGDYIEVPATAFAQVDSAITISFWQYGDPAHQPQDQSIFEGYDQYGRRVLNMHLPWSDGSVYWDAGSGSSYDRISKAADSTIWEGRWNHWVVTKNVKTGAMRIYLNGVSWVSGTSKNRRMNGITSFKIGSAGNGTLNYDGRIDEFAMWNAELDAATIRKLDRSLNAFEHPFYSNLKFYYGFTYEKPMTAHDLTNHGFDGQMVGPPAALRTPGRELFIGFQPQLVRPEVTIEQGVFTSHVDSVLVIDTVANDAMQIVRYNDPNDPTRPTDTLTVWPAYYHYTFDSAGKIVDSTLVKPDATIHLMKTPYFKKSERRSSATSLGATSRRMATGFLWERDLPGHTMSPTSVRCCTTPYICRHTISRSWSTSRSSSSKGRHRATRSGFRISGSVLPPTARRRRSRSS